MPKPIKKRNFLTLIILFFSLINLIAQDNIVPVNENKQNNLAENNLALSKISYSDKYLSLGVGMGTSYGGYGIKAQFKTINKLGLAYHFGVGTTFENDINANVGVKYYFYKWAYLNPQLGYFLYKNEGLDLNHNYYTERKVDFYGAFFIGGDIYFNKHIGIDAGLGIVIFVDYVGPSATIGVAYKF